MRLWHEADGRTSVARVAFVVIATLTACNALFNAVAVASGMAFPYTSFLGQNNDLFSDYFKLAMSYPGGETIALSRFPGVRDLFAHYPHVMRYASDGQPVTNLHLMPFTTLFTLANVGAMRLVDPMVEYLLASAAMLAWSAWIVRSASRSRAQTLLWSGAAFISYPMLLTLDRGNLPAGLTGLAIVAAMLMATRRRAVYAAAILLALAVNVRPNAIVFAVPLLLFYRGGDRLKAFLTLGVAGWVILAISFVVSNSFYPAYTPASLIAGVGHYHYVYVFGDLGLPSGSSLFGAVKALFGYSARMETVAALVALAILCGGIALYLQRRITASTFLFLVCAGYCLGSSVFGDYHLLVFLAPPLCRAIEMRQAPDRAGRAPPVDPLLAVLASCLMLSPKNYMFIHIVSYQVVFNPLLLLVASGVILLQGWSRPRPPVLDPAGESRSGLRTA